MIWLATTALAADPVQAWTGSRWYLAIEETTPAPLELSAAENKSFRTRALQLEAVMSCPTAQPLGKSVEVHCQLDSVAMRATPGSTSRSEATNPGNAEVLADMVSRLQTTKLVLTATPDGRITNVDLPDVTASTRRESDSREVLRRLTYDLVAGIALHHPESWKSGWMEKNSPLLRAPTQSSGSGLSKVTHTVGDHNGSTIVQSQGEGTFTAPYVPWEFSYEGGITRTSTGGGSTTSGGGGFGAATPSAPTAADASMTSVGPNPSAGTPSDYTFHGTLTSVTVFDPATELPTERVWAMLGHPTSSSVGNMQGLSIFYSGKIRRIGKSDAVDMGVTEVVAPPGTTVDGIGVWQPMSVL